MSDNIDIQVIITSEERQATACACPNRLNNNIGYITIPNSMLEAFEDKPGAEDSADCGIALRDFVIGHELGHLSIAYQHGVDHGGNAEPVADELALYYMLAAGKQVGPLLRADCQPRLDGLTSREVPGKTGSGAQTNELSRDEARARAIQTGSGLVERVLSYALAMIVAEKNGDEAIARAKQMGRLIHTLLGNAVAMIAVEKLSTFIAVSSWHGAEILGMASRLVEESNKPPSSGTSPDRLPLPPTAELYLGVLKAVREPGPVISIADDGQNHSLGCILLPPRRNAAKRAELLGVREFADSGFAGIGPVSTDAAEREALWRLVRTTETYLGGKAWLAIMDTDTKTALYNNLSCVMLRLGEYSRAKAYATEAVYHGRSSSYSGNWLNYNLRLAYFMGFSELGLKTDTPSTDSSQSFLDWLCDNISTIPADAVESVYYIPSQTKAKLPQICDEAAQYRSFERFDTKAANVAVCNALTKQMETFLWNDRPSIQMAATGGASEVTETVLSDKNQKDVARFRWWQLKGVAILMSVYFPGDKLTYTLAEWKVPRSLLRTQTLSESPTPGPGVGAPQERPLTFLDCGSSVHLFHETTGESEQAVTTLIRREDAAPAHCPKDEMLPAPLQERRDFGTNTCPGGEHTLLSLQHAHLFPLTLHLAPSKVASGTLAIPVQRTRPLGEFEAIGPWFGCFYGTGALLARRLT